MRPLPLREKEYRETLYRLERRAIIPLKWCILVITFLLWAVFLGEKSTRGYLIMPMGGWPGLPVLITFIVYAASIVVQTWWFYFHEVRSAFIRPLTLLSYLGEARVTGRSARRHHLGDHLMTLSTSFHRREPQRISHLIRQRRGNARRQIRAEQLEGDIGALHLGRLAHLARVPKRETVLRG